MLTCRIFLLPCLYFGLPCERIGLEDAVYDPRKLSTSWIYILHPTFVALDAGLSIISIFLGFCCYRKL